MMKPVSVELKKQIDSYSNEFLMILEEWIHKKRKYEKFDFKQNEKKEEDKTIGQLLCQGNNDRDNIGYKQFADILMACRRAYCVNEFKLYIAYKGSKDNSSWRQELDRKSLSEHLNELITTQLKKLADEIADKKLPAIEESFEDIYLAVLDKFLGYLYWGVRVSGANRGEIKCLKA
ncbi:MAG TPA: hypothetical protein VHY08_24550 [Bacillota bacterium]|nr:hypothetical protein [Bacillota bacterium]